MDSLFITKEDFWLWFDRENDISSNLPATDFGAAKASQKISANKQANKRIRLDYECQETAKYKILWGRYKPGKKHKIWEEDGYLTLVGRMAHVCDEKGRLIEEPTVLDEINYEIVKSLGELVLGTTEIQIQEEEN